MSTVTSEDPRWAQGDGVPVAQMPFGQVVVDEGHEGEVTAMELVGVGNRRGARKERFWPEEFRRFSASQLFAYWPLRLSEGVSFNS